MTYKLPRVLILYTGGTIGMDSQQLNAKTTRLYLPQLSPASLKKRLFNLLPELRKLARCQVEVLFNRDSAHIGPTEWVFIAKKIQDNWKSYDGFVLLHGTDTLAYTASALSFLLLPCLKPVILTGSQRPLSELRNDARNNLISAVEIAAHGPRSVVNQVCVFFGQELFQGNRVRKKSASDFSAFESPGASLLAQAGTSIKYITPIQRKLDHKTLKLEPCFNRQVLSLHITPGFPSQCFGPSLLTQLKGIVLITFASGTGPTHHPQFIHFLNTARKYKISITLVTEGKLSNVHYSSGEKLVSKGCLWAGSMTPECAFVKTSFLLGQSRVNNPSVFKSLWKQELAGERAG